MAYNLTESQKNLLRHLVQDAEAGEIDGEEFSFTFSPSGSLRKGKGNSLVISDVKQSSLEALAAEGLLRMVKTDRNTYRCSFTPKAYEAVESDFGSVGGVQSKEKEIREMKTASNTADPRKVAVVYGRDKALYDSLLTLLRALDLNPVEWSEAITYTGTGSPYNKDVLDALFSNVQAVVVLLTPDDVVQIRSDLGDETDPDHEKAMMQPRANVIFEAGMAFVLHPERTILVEVGKRLLRPISDLAGINTVRIEDRNETDVRGRKELAQRLKNAGCAVNIDGSQWLTAGDFSVSADQPKLEVAAEGITTEVL